MLKGKEKGKKGAEKSLNQPRRKKEEWTVQILYNLQNKCTYNFRTKDYNGSTNYN